jgi:multidrug transporter EmrE-like cation transporter
MVTWILFIVYIFMSATGLLLIKTGSSDMGFAVRDGIFNIQMSPKLLLGFVFYVCSFLLSVYIMSKMKLSLFYPLGTGTILVATCLFGYFFLKEHIGLPQIVGMTLILSGVVAMNIK